jgi:ribosomal-protein-alanine N-acetyltransferase
MAEIEKQAAIHPWSLSQFLGSSLSQDQHSLVLELNGSEVVGFAVTQRVLDDGTLMNIAVRPEHQGRGFGSRLLQAALDGLRQQGAARCFLEVRAGNAAAIALYRRHGFIDDGLRRDYYPSPNGREDALLMSRRLEAPQ